MHERLNNDYPSVNKDGMTYEPVAVPATGAYSAAFCGPLPVAPQSGLLGFFFSPTFNWMSSVVDILPSPAHTSTLVNFYFSHVDCFSKVSVSLAN